LQYKNKMGISKTDFFTEKQNLLANKFKALGHPARIAIIQHIIKQKKCICSNIVEELPLAQPTISQHLKELKATGIIKGTIEGKGICYCVDAELILEIIASLTEVIQTINEAENSCCN